MSTKEKLTEGGEEEDEDTGMRAAYSIEDMLGALTDSDQEEFVDSVDVQADVSKGCQSLPTSDNNPGNEIKDSPTDDDDDDKSRAKTKSPKQDSNTITNEASDSTEEVRKDQPCPSESLPVSPIDVIKTRDGSVTSESTSPSFRISSDIGGRFHVDGTVYADGENDGPPPLPNSPPPLSESTNDSAKMVENDIENKSVNSTIEGNADNSVFYENVGEASIGSGETRDSKGHGVHGSRDKCSVPSDACSSFDVVNLSTKTNVSKQTHKSFGEASKVAAAISRFQAIESPVNTKFACSTPIGNQDAPAFDYFGVGKSAEPTATELSFTSDVSISNQSFKTQAVAGSDPFVGLRRLESFKGFSPVNKHGPLKNTIVPDIVIGSPGGSQVSILKSKTADKVQAIDEKGLIKAKHFDTGSFELLEKDVYEELGQWGEATAANNDPWTPSNPGLEDSSETVGASYEGGLSSTWERSNDPLEEENSGTQQPRSPLVATYDDAASKPPQSPMEVVSGDIQGSITSTEAGHSYEGIMSSTWEESYYGNVEETGKKSGGNESGDRVNTSPIGGQDIYENVSFRGNGATLRSTETGDIDGWSSDEFETYDASPENTLEIEPTPPSAVKKEGKVEKPVKVRLPSSSAGAKRSSRTSMSPDIQQIPQVFDKMIGRLNDKISSKLGRKEDTAEDDSMLIQVTLNMDKHPPAQMPPVPLGLNQLQLKRRHVLSAIVDSETSYLESLRRLVKEYESPLLDAKPVILPKSVIRVIFYKMNDILQCHNMFHIELTECVKNWDEKETIGNVFTASFSKAVVFETYSAYVNNFSVAMDTAKKQARIKPAFAEFLKERICTENKIGMSPDKLSLFGLMVKPVQRFPQFIMLLQDLLKYTPLDHHDRLPLQMALTELETLTHRLNDTKRDSESRHDVKRILNSVTGRHAVRQNDARYLIRQDDALSMELKDGEMKTKQRRLFLMNDLLLCVTVGTKESEGGVVERYKYKWSVYVRDCDVIENAVTPHYQVRCGSGQTTVTALKQEKAVLSADNPHKAEVDDMLHDMPIIEQMGQLVGQLRMKYQGLNMNVINGLLRSLQINIQQKSDVNKSVIQLSIPAGKAGGRIRLYFQVDSSDIREDWLLELQNTKLALEPKNCPAWLMPEHERVLHFKQPLFIRPLLIDVTNHDTRKCAVKRVRLKVECALSVTLPSLDLPGIGQQHLWVCSSDPSNDTSRGQVTVVRVHGNTPHVIESFRTSDVPIICAELVPGFTQFEITESYEGQSIFAEDTVWMGLQDNSIQVRGVVEEGRRAPLLTFTCIAPISCMRYACSRLYVGLQNGQVAIYSRDTEGVWQIEKPQTIQLGTSPVACLISVRSDVLAACSRYVHVISVATHITSRGTQLDVTMNTHEVGSEAEGSVQCMVQASAGLFVSYKDRPTVRLYHLETMVHLQDVSVSSVIHKLIEGKHLAHEQQDTFQSISITCMMAYKGMLWIGTSVGCVLTLPLPRLEGVPQIKVRPTVSYHSHTGPVKFLVPIHCGHLQLHPEMDPSIESSTEPNNDPGVQSEEVQQHQVMHLQGITTGESNDYQLTQSEEIAAGANIGNGVLDQYGGSNLSMAKNLFASTPELRGDGEMFGNHLSPLEEDVRVLYGSLMRLNNDDYDAELLGMRHAKRRKPHIPGLSAVTKRASAINSRVSQFVDTQIMNKPPPSPQSRYATLPIVRENGVRGSVSELNESVNQTNQESSDTSSQDACSVNSGQTNQQTNEETNSQASSSQTRQLYIPQSVPVTVLNSTILSKSSLVLSGGQGHINWNTPRNVDLSYDDLCLLMWQNRQ